MQLCISLNTDLMNTDLNNVIMYRKSGEIFSSSSVNITGVGNASIIFANHTAIVFFTIRITLKSTTQNFEFGLNRDLLVTHKQITPVSGGQVSFFRDGTYNTNLGGYGGFMEAKNQFWRPGRVYDNSGSIGGWSENIFNVGDILTGVCYGTI